MDQGSPKPAVLTPSVAAGDALPLVALESAAYDALCEWFDAQLEILAERFACFETPVSTKSQR